MIASRAPTTRSPHPAAARRGATWCCSEMLEQGHITQPEYDEARQSTRCRAATDVRPPTVESQAARTSRAGCASSSSTATAPAGVRRRPEGAARRSTPTSRPPPSRRRRLLAGPAARPRRWSRSTTTPARSGRWSAAATIDARPFNLATQGQRQPGSSIKPFMLAAALDDGHRARLVCGRRASASSTCRAPTGSEKFVVTTTRAPTRACEPRQRRRRLRQLGLRRGRPQDRDTSGSRGSRSGWASARRSRPTRR